jgi:hypothetical protein
MANSNNILDGEELFRHEGFEIPFSSYWKKMETYLVYAYYAIIAILAVSPYFTKGINILAYLISSIVILGLILYIHHFKKLKNKNLKTRLATVSKRWRFFIITIAIAIFTSLLFLLSIVVLVVLITLLFYGQPDREGIIMVLVFIPLTVLSGLQVFYYFYNLKYLSKHNQLAKNA